MQTTLYTIIDTVERTVYLECGDPITAEFELEMLAAEHPHLWLDIEEVTVTTDE